MSIVLRPVDLDASYSFLVYVIYQTIACSLDIIYCRMERYTMHNIEHVPTTAALTCAPWKHGRRRSCPGSQRSRAREHWAGASHRDLPKCQHPMENLQAHIIFKNQPIYQRHIARTTVDLREVRQLTESSGIAKGDE